MSVQKALLARLPTDASKVWSIEENRPIPSVADNEVRIRHAVVALNPYDWKGVKYKFSLQTESKVLGRDGSGTIVAVGRGVRRLQVGDKVWFCSNSSLSNSGAFQEYSVHRAEEVGRLPAIIPLASGATLGTGLLTAAITLLKCFGLSLKTSEDKEGDDTRRPWIFIVAGSSSTGQYLIQLSKLLGLRVICTSSAANNGLLQDLGAEAVIDRELPIIEKVEKIRSITGQSVAYAVDNVGPSTVPLCYQVLEGAKDGDHAQLVALAGVPKEIILGERSIIQQTISFSTTFFGHPDFSVPFLDTVYDLLETKRLKPSGHQFAGSGLSAVEVGLDMLEKGRVTSMKKLLVGLDSTSDLTPTAVITRPKRRREELEEESSKHRRKEIIVYA